MALPSYVTQRDIRGTDVPENIVIIQELTSTKKQILVWDDLKEIDRNRFQTIVDQYGGSYPITSSAGYLKAIFANTITGSDPINISFSSPSLTINVSGTEFTYTPSSNSITFNTLITELNSVISGSATASISGNEILITNDNAGTGENVTLVDDDLFRFIGANDLTSIDAIPGVDDNITALNNNTIGNDSAFEYFKYAIRIITEAHTGLRSENRDITEVLNKAFSKENNSLNIGKTSHHGEIGVYEVTSIFSYDPSVGITKRRDIEEHTGSGSASLSNGLIVLSTGTTNSSRARIKTVERGNHTPGKTSHAGIEIKFPNGLSGDGVARFGLKDSFNGMFFEITPTSNKIVILRNGVRVEEIEQSNWNIDNVDGVTDSDLETSFTFKPLEEGYEYDVEFNTHIGKALFSITIPVEGNHEKARSYRLHEVVHQHSTDGGGASIVVDPNLPLVAEIENGTTGTDFELAIGVRHFDVYGKLDIPVREIADFRSTTVTANSREPIMAFRRVSDFFGATRENSITVYITGAQVLTDRNLNFRAYSAPSGSVDGAWTTPDDYDSSETGIESNVTLTTLDKTNAILLQGPTIFSGAAQGTSKIAFSSNVGRRIPLIDLDELVIEAENLEGNDANVQVSLELAEEW